MNRTEFVTIYNKEISDFKTNLKDDKINIKTTIHNRLRETGYNEIVTYKETDLGIKKKH